MTKISLHIIAIFTIAIFTSFIPDLYPEFFGDWICEGAIRDNNLHLQGCHYGDLGRHNPSTHWGWRHWLYFFMGLSLFALQVAQIIKKLTKLK